MRLDAGRLARLAAIAVGAFLIILGFWALFSPLSFYEQLATFPPYNRHLFHDVGAFQIGIGSALLLGAFMTDTLLLGLTAGAIGASLHAISHFADRNLGGRTTDPWALSLLALVLVVGAVARRRQLTQSDVAEAEPSDSA
jgi:hypothetical protein